jgi:uncharacterized protein (TIGR02453 family)
MPSRFPGFPPQTLAFLSDLKANNNRDWFQAHKADYEQYVKAPMVECVLALGEELGDFGNELITAPDKAIYRIYRDVRFSKDKSPYKTHVAAVFSPRGYDKHAAAGLYFHFSPEELLVGGGIYAPGSTELLAIRERIAGGPDEFRSILKDRTFRRRFGEMTGAQLKRIPKGFPADHPAADLLVYKQFLAGAKLDPRIVQTPKLSPQLVKHFRAIEPFLVFLNSGLARTNREPPRRGLRMK